MSGVPSGFVPRTAYGSAIRVPMPDSVRSRSSSRPYGLPGIGIAPNGRPAAASVNGTGPDQSTASSIVERISRSGAGPNPFWWNV